MHSAIGWLAVLVIISAFVVVVCIETIYMYPTMVRTVNEPAVDQPFDGRIDACRIDPMSCDYGKSRPDLINCYFAAIVTGRCSLGIGTYTTVADAQFYCNRLAPVGSTVSAFRNANDPANCSFQSRSAVYEYQNGIAIFVTIVVVLMTFGFFVVLFTGAYVQVCRPVIPLRPPSECSNTTTETTAKIPTVDIAVPPVVVVVEPPTPAGSDLMLLDAEPGAPSDDGNDRSSEINQA